MEKSTLYDLLNMGILRKWRKDEEVRDNYFTEREKEIKGKIRNRIK